MGTGRNLCTQISVFLLNLVGLCWAELNGETVGCVRRCKVSNGGGGGAVMCTVFTGTADAHQGR